LREEIAMGHTTPSALAKLLDDASLEITAKDVEKLAEARSGIPQGTRVNITSLGNEDVAMQLAAARAVKRFGFTPVPHIAARRVGSEAALEQHLSGLDAEGLSEHVFVVGGDPHVPLGPFPDSLTIIRSGVLKTYGVEDIGISGYPEGHPAIPDSVLWSALEEKIAELSRNSLAGQIITQFGFDVEPVVGWIEAVRARGISEPIRIGVPGPAGMKRLLTYASRFGVNTSAGIARKYGFSLANLLGTAGPDRFITEFAAAYDPAHHGDVRLHFYTFGGLKTTAEWFANFRKGL
jgi:methylenetetrahydrofolate reductase (NADPH)